VDPHAGLVRSVPQGGIAVRLYLTSGESAVIPTESPNGWTLEEGAAGIEAQCLAVDPHASNLIYAGTTRNGVLRSTAAA